MNDNPQKRFAALAKAVADTRDKTAFAELFDHFAPRINAYLRRLGLADNEAEDLAQEVMIVLWHKSHLFDPAKSSLSTWLFRVARNRRIDMARREKSGALDPDEPMLHPTDVTPADELVDADTRDKHVREAMQALPPEQLELVHMAFFLGWPHSRIAEEKALPLGTVKSRIRLAFGRLRHALENDERVDTDFD